MQIYWFMKKVGHIVTTRLQTLGHPYLKHQILVDKPEREEITWET